MEALLIRTGSGPVQSSPKLSVSEHEPVTGILFPGKKIIRSFFHLEIMNNNKKQSIRRTRSETELIRTASKVSCRLSDSGSRSFPAKIPEQVEDLFDDEGGVEALILRRKCLNMSNYDRNLRENDVLADEVDFSGGGIGKGRDVGGGNTGGGDADQSNLSEYYESLLKDNPGNPLILRNYGKYLHVVKGDLKKAEECYSRAILASPGDGEVLSLYGKLIWESYRDEERANSYFDQAVQAAPDNCYVMGSYASFLWNTEEEEEEELAKVISTPSASTLVEAC